MEKKLLLRLILILLVGIILISSTSQAKSNILNSETIDQFQEIDTGGFWIDKIAWQEFQPEVKKLTKIEVKIMSGGGIQPPINLYIEQPLGTIIKSKQLQSSEISTSPNWITFDIEDIKLNIGESYYIKLSFSPGGSYYWYGSTNNPYKNGISNRGETWDWCFRTIVDKSVIKLPFKSNINLLYYILNVIDNK